MFRVFSLVVSGANIALTIGALITDEVLKARLDALQAEVNDLNKQLANIGLDMKSGIDFFKAIAEQMSKINYSSAEVDVLTQKEIGPLLIQIKAEANKILEDVSKIPDPTQPTDPSSNFYEQMFAWTMRGATVLGIAISVKDFAQNLRKYFKDKKERQSSTDESAHENGLNLDDSNRVNPNEEEVRVQTEAEHPVSTDEVPRTPSSEAKGPTVSEKLSTAFDTVMFVLVTVSLVLNIIHFIDSEKALEKEIADLEQKVKDAKAAAVNLSADEVKFFSDVPSFFLFIADQMNAVIQIATLAQTVKVVDAPDDKIAALLRSVASFKPFTDDDYKFMATEVAKMDAAQVTYKDNSDQMEKQLKTIFDELSARLPNTKFIQAFTDAANVFATLKQVLDASVPNFNFYLTSLKAVNTLKQLAKSQLDINLMVTVMSSMLGRTPTTDDLSVMLALYTDLDSYGSYDLTTIRATYKTIDTDAFQKFVNDSIVKLYGTLAQGQSLPNSAGAFLNSLNCIYKIQLTGSDVQVLYSAKNATTYTQKWHSNTANQGTKPYKLTLQNTGDLQLLDSKNVTLWHTDTANKGTPPYQLVATDTGVVLSDSKNTQLWHQS